MKMHGFQQQYQNTNYQKMGCMNTKMPCMNQKHNKQKIKSRQTDSNGQVGQSQGEAAEKMSKEDKKLMQLYELIQSNDYNALLLDPEVFDRLHNVLKSNNWTKFSKNALIQLLEKHIRYSSKLITSKMATIRVPFQYNVSDYGSIFGKALYEIQNNITTANNKHIRSLRYGDEFKRNNFSLSSSDKNQHEKLQKQIKKLANDDHLAIFYIMSYLKRSCEQLQQKGVSIQEINKKLKKFVDSMNQRFAPNADFEADMLYIYMFQQNEFDRLKNQKHDFNKINWKLTQKDKKDELNHKIAELAQVVKTYEETLHNLTYNECISRKGFGYNLDMKVDNIKDEESIKRVKEKLLKDQIEKYYKNKKFESTRIKDLRKEEFKYKRSVMKKIYADLDEVNFDVTDSLRGRCFFKRLTQINETALAIINRIKQSLQNNVKLIQIDNRLRTSTNDLVMKIQIGEVVTEFQLCLRFTQTQTVIYHKMYEINRSETLSPVVQLYQIERKITNDYFTALDEAIINSQQPKDVRHNIKEKQKQLQKFINFKQDGDDDGEQEQDETGTYIYDANPNVTKVIPQKVEYLRRQKCLRTGDCYKQIGELRLASAWYKKQFNEKQDWAINQKARIRCIQLQKQDPELTLQNGDNLRVLP